MDKIILTALSTLMQIFITIYSIFVLAIIVENKKYSTFQKFISTLIFGICAFISAYFCQGNQVFKILLCAVPTFLILKFILKLNILKTFIITISTFMFFAITELLSVIIVSTIFNHDPNNLDEDFKLLLLLLFIQMLMLFVALKITIYFLNKFKKNNQVSVNINSNRLFNIILITIVCMLPKILITSLNSYEYSIGFLITNLLETVVMVFLTFIFLKRTLERDKAQSELIISEMHNKTMVGMVDGVRTLKHDYNNIIQALSGYIKTKQYDKLEEHINKVLQECNVVNNFSMINPETFNEPAIYGIMGAKYFIAADKEITVDLDVSCDFTKISFPMPEFSRILGILLDNAIEATQKAKNKYIRFEARYDSRKNADIIRIINTYDTSIDIDLNKIYEKGVSSKKVKSGIGLWEVKKLIKKNKNSQIFATVENQKFVQNIIIERLIQNEETKSKETFKNKDKNIMLPIN